MNLALQSPGADALSGNGIVLRGVSPVSALAGHEILSGFEGFDQQEQTMLYSPNQLLDYNLDNNSSVSPHSHTRRGNMSTQYGNFLYQVEAKPFPGQRQSKPPAPEDRQHALKNQLMYLQAAQANGKFSAPVQQVNPKQIHKQLKQLQKKKQHQDAKTGNTAVNSSGAGMTSHPQEILLQNMVHDMSQRQNSSKLNVTQLSKIQLLQQNYQGQQPSHSKAYKKASTGAGATLQGNPNHFSTIQSAFDSLQSGPSRGGQVTGKSKKGSQIQNQIPKGHQRYATIAANPNPLPAYNTLKQASVISGGNGHKRERNGSKLKASKNRNKNTHVTGSDSLDPALFSPGGTAHSGHGAAGFHGTFQTVLTSGAHTQPMSS